MVLEQLIDIMVEYKDIMYLHEIKKLNYLIILNHYYNILRILPWAFKNN